MHLTRHEFENLDELNLRSFLEAGIEEGLYLDYKQNISIAKPSEKREFLKDLTAFANAHGGMILIGAKQPSPTQSVDEQLIDVPDAEKLAQALERLASSSVDPRIPGLRIRTIPYAKSGSCIGVYVPPSLSRPHMVQHEGHRAFYIRHSESSFPMSTHEIRESVIASMSAQEKAKTYIKERERDICRYLKKANEPLFLVQAMPLIDLEQPINMYDERLIDVLRGPLNGPSRRDKYRLYADLCSDIAPRLTIDGLLGRDQRENPNWWTEIHRNGYMSVAFRHVETYDGVHIINRGHCEIFQAFCDMVTEAWSTLEIDLPHAIACVYLDAKGSKATHTR